MNLSNSEILAFAKLKYTMNSGNPSFPTFLEWIADRLEFVHKEDKLMDYMHAIRRYVADFKEIERLL